MMQQQQLTTITNKDFSSFSMNTLTSEYVATAEIPVGQNDIQICQNGNTICLRLQTWNVYGTYDWGEWIVIATLVLAPPGALGHTDGKYTWVLVASAVGYEMEAMIEGVDSWNTIFDGAFRNGAYFWEPPSGKHRFRTRASGQSGKVSPWVGLEITIP